MDNIFNKLFICTYTVCTYGESDEKFLDTNNLNFTLKNNVLICENEENHNTVVFDFLKTNLVNDFKNRELYITDNNNKFYISKFDVKYVTVGNNTNVVSDIFDSVNHIKLLNEIEYETPFGVDIDNKNDEYVKYIYDSVWEKYVAIMV